MDVEVPWANRWRMSWMWSFKGRLFRFHVNSFICLGPMEPHASCEISMISHNHQRCYIDNLRTTHSELIDWFQGAVETMVKRFATTSPSYRIEEASSFSRKSGRAKVPWILRIFVPSFAPNFAPNFPQIFWGFFVLGTSMPKMTGRPGYRTMEMIGGSSAPYLARTPCVPLFCTLFNRGGNRSRAFRLPGAGGDHFHCTVEPSSGHIRCREPRPLKIHQKSPSALNAKSPGKVKEKIHKSFLDPESRARKPWSAHCELKHSNFGG